MACHDGVWGWSLLVLCVAIAIPIHNDVVDAGGLDDVKATCGFKEDDVRFFDVRVAATRVPSDLTTYVCQRRLIPISLDEDFHAIAFLPLVNNTDIVHHMILFGCSDRTHGNVHRCDNGDNQCRQFLVQWSRGISGPICNPPAAGNRFGFTSVKTFLLQVHWNNQNGADGLQDSSGFRVFYTSKFRKNDLGNVQIGQNDLEIPAGQTRFPQSGSCSSECTKSWLPQPIYLTRAHIHIHYTGVGGLMEIVRNGTVVSTVVNDQSYDYNQPPAHTFDRPFEVLPGDEVRVTCLFNTRDGARKRNRTLHWGEGSDGEMCYAFVTYYPMVTDFDQCIQFGDYDICTKTGFTALGECILPGFVHVFRGMGDEILAQCSNTNNTSRQQRRHSQRRDDDNDNDDTHSHNNNTLCSFSKTCREAVLEVTNHPCMQGRLKQEAERIYLPGVPTWPAVKNIMEKVNKSC